MTTNHTPTLTAAAQGFGMQVGAKMFDGRKGHGGGDGRVSERHLSEAAVSALAAVCYERGFKSCVTAATTQNAALTARVAELEAALASVLGMAECGATKKYGMPIVERARAALKGAA